MASLNISGAILGSDHPSSTVLRHENQRILTNFVGQMILTTLTNSHILSLMCPKTYYARINAELLMRHAETGTEVCNLEDPHLASSHYCVLKRGWCHNTKLGLYLVRSYLSDKIMPMCPIMYEELESPPDTAWKRAMKVMINQLLHHGVYEA